MKHVVKQLCLIAFSSAFLFVPHSLLAHEPCIQLRKEICPHKIIRSIQSNQAEFNQKALCICIADFQNLLKQQMSETEQNKLFEFIEKQYQMQPQTFLQLLHGN